MSFSYTAVGDKHEVVAQLRRYEGTESMGIGAGIAALLANHLAQDTVQGWGDQEFRYVVEASGHSGGGSAMNVKVSLTPHLVHPARGEAGEEAPAAGHHAGHGHTGTHHVAGGGEATLGLHTGRSHADLHDAPDVTP
jgi:hypothetical protein